MGDVLGITEANGNLIAQYLYDDWGKLVSIYLKEAPLMAGITSGKNKWVVISFRIIVFLLFLICIVRRFLISYSLIHSYGLGLESSLGCTVLVFVSLILFCLSFIRFFKKNSVIFIVFAIISIVISLIASSKIPNVYQYESSKNDNNVSSCFLFDNYIDKSSRSYYYLKKVELFDAHWIGCSLYKEFETENSFEDLMQDTNDSNVTINYYYLKDPSGRRIKEYIEKKLLSEAFDIDYVYDNEIHTEKYSVYEYGNQLEFVSEADDMVFYISANKNKHTSYDLERFATYGNTLLNELKNMNTGDASLR